MKVALLSFTPEPLKAIYVAYRIMHHEVPDSLEELDVSREEMEEVFRRLLKEGVQVPFEFVQTTWLFKGVSRQFTHQLVRHRTAAYMQQSMRVVPKESFADRRDFIVPPKIRKNERAYKIYKKTMYIIQHYYRKLRELGVDVQDARCILPIGIHTCIMMTINYRNLLHFARQRLCLAAQWEIRKATKLMREEVKRKMGEIFAEPMAPPCESLGVCWMPHFDCPKRRGK